MLTDEGTCNIAHYYIFDCKYDLTVQNKEVNTALHIACKIGNDLVAQMIVDCDGSRALWVMDLTLDTIKPLLNDAHKNEDTLI